MKFRYQQYHWLLTVGVIFALTFAGCQGLVPSGAGTDTNSTDSRAESSNATVIVASKDFTEEFILA